ncbi:MAG: 5'/3'-nucleotidase SurE [Candidatus Izemoplasma sp.]
MIILLTNDDGYDAKRILFAKEILKKYGTVYLVAPKVEQSAKSASLTIGPIEFEKIDEYTYAVQGTPVDCVTFAIHGLNIKPDLVVSGINHGYNLGIDTIYSGTLGAALQAQYFGYKTIAFSGDYKADKLIINEFEDTLNYIIEKDLTSVNHTLNINFPPDKFIKSKGYLFTKKHLRRYEHVGRIDGNVFYRSRKYLSDKVDKDTDLYAHNNGYISITKVPLQ